MASYFHPSHLAVDPAGGAAGAAAPVPAVALALKAVGGVGAAGAVAAGAVGAAVGAGAGVLLNKLDAFEVYSLTFSLNGTLLKYSLALVPKFLNIEGFGALGEALGELAALSLAALY